MKTNSILIESLSIKELDSLINSSVKNTFSEVQKEYHSNLNNSVLLTREETCKFLKIDSSTLWAWTNKGKVKAYGIGSRRYYKKDELLKCLTLLNK